MPSQALPAPPAQRLPVREKIGYSCGDLANNFIFQTLIVFQAGFYTDVMGISAASLGLLLFVVRLSDAITDPIMGTIADRTNHRWGKFRPWLLWAALPLVGLFWLAFTVPSGTSDQFRLVYAFATYGLLMVAYTVSNVPYLALTAVITGDTNERTSLSAYRYFAISIGMLLVHGLTLPLVGKFGQGDDQRGWSLTVTLYGAIAVVLFVITFFNVKERVKPPPGQKEDLRQDFKDMIRNRPWLILFTKSTCQFAMMALRGGALYYYFTYYVDRAALNSFLGHLGLFERAGETGSGVWFTILDSVGLIVREGGDPSRVGFSLFSISGVLLSLTAIFSARPLAERFGKKLVYGISLSVATFFQMCFFFVAPDQVGLMFLLFALASLANAPAIPVSSAMLADAVDYSEWKNGRRATGFLYAAHGFGVKAGMGLGGALIGIVLASYGYTPETAAAGDGQVLHGIRLAVSLYAAAPMLIAIIALWFYPITKTVNITMAAELAERRRKAEAADAAAAQDSLPAAQSDA